MVTDELQPSNLDELVHALGHEATFRISGTDTHAADRLQSSASTRLVLQRLNGVVAYEPNDQVTVVMAGTELSHIAELIGPDRFQIPGKGIGTVGGAISMGDLGDTGSQCCWRQVVLGLQVLMADGSLVRFGSRVVKNVAGYDAHKLFIGARGVLGVIVEATIRLTPMSSALIVVGDGVRQIGEIEPTMERFMRRTKNLFDPGHRFNPGEWGFF